MLNVIFKAHKLVDMYANWTFRSGNRYTLPTYEYGVALEPNNFLYGRSNPIYLQREQDVYQRPTLKLTSIFPVLPSIRYTRWF